MSALDRSMEAVDRGNAILNKFQKSRTRDQSFEVNDQSVNEDNSVSVGYYDAVADGSNVGLMYSATKKMRDVSMSGFIFSTPMGVERERSYEIGSEQRGTIEPEALDLVRIAMSKVISLGNKDKLDKGDKEEGEDEDGDEDAFTLTSPIQTALHPNADKNLHELYTYLQGVEEQLESIGGK